MITSKTGDRWKEILRRRVEDEGGRTDSRNVEAAITHGSVWVSEQEAVKSSVVGLCLEYVSKHIVRRTILKNPEPKAEVLLFQLAHLANYLERQGIDVSKISKEILEDISKKQSRPNRPMRRWSKSKTNKKSGARIW